MSMYAGELEMQAGLIVPRQIMVFGNQWTPGVAAFCKSYLNNPVLVFASRLEAAIYGKVKQVTTTYLDTFRARGGH
jgi:hypothetical protein